MHGCRAQLAVNVLAYAKLMDCLRGNLAAHRPSRIVNVGSDMMEGLDPSDLQWKSRPYDAVAVYAATKQADAMLTYAAARAYAADAIAVNAAHPGSVPTSRLVRDALGDLALLMADAADSPDDAAATEVMLATSPAIANGTAVLATGGYYRYREAVSPAPYAEDADACDRLWAAVAKLNADRSSGAQGHQAPKSPRLAPRLRSGRADLMRRLADARRPSERWRRVGVLAPPADPSRMRDSDPGAVSTSPRGDELVEIVLEQTQALR